MHYMYGLYLQVEGRICIRYDSDSFATCELLIEVLEDEVGLVGGVADKASDRNQLPCKWWVLHQQIERQ